MRNPERIRPFLDKVAEAWEKYPDLRFGQLVMDIVPDTDRLWNCEEGEFLEKLDCFVSRVEDESRGAQVDKSVQGSMTKKINPFNNTSRKIKCIENRHDLIGDGNYKTEEELEIGKEYTFVPHGGHRFGLFIHVKELPNKYGYPFYLFEELEAYDESIGKKDAEYYLFKELEKSRKDYEAGRYSSGRDVLKRIKKIIREGDKSANPERISGYVDVLERVWNKYPDLRLGQLIQYGLENEDAWDAKDEDIIEALKKL